MTRRPIARAGQAPAPLLLFTRLELSFPPGPPPGRYVVDPTCAAAVHEELDGSHRAAGEADVLLLRSEAALARLPRARVRRRADPVEPDLVPRELALTSVTLVESGRIGDGPDAVRAELARRVADLDAADACAARALAVLARAIAAFRVAARDPYVRDLTLEDCERVLVGAGTAAELDQGGWTLAHALPRDARRGRADPASGRVVAEVLAGDATVGEVEELLLRVHLDVDQGRWRAAAAGLLAVATLLEDGPLAEACRVAARPLLEGSARPEQRQALVRAALRAHRPRGAAGAVSPT